MNAGTLIVGAGQAGACVASSLRSQGYAHPVTLVGAERYGPYHRPPLSKGFLLGKVQVEALAIRSDDYFRDNGITLVTGETIARVDLEQTCAQGASGRTYCFDRLVLATGVEPVRLALPGADLPGVMYLGCVQDAIALKARLGVARKLVVVGGGYIGLELAASARTLNVEVTVLEAADRLLKRVAPPVIADFLRAAHQRRGVDVRLGAAVTRITGAGGHATGVELADGSRLDAEVVVIGIGSRPRSQLARDLGLALTPSGAIEVDEHMVTSDPRVLAVGDCVAAPDPAGGGVRMQIPSIQNALSQGAVATSTILGKLERNRSVPWFWSDQYDIKLQIVGHGVAHDDVVVRGDPASERFAAFSLRGGRVAAAAMINRPAEFMQARKCIEMELSIDRAMMADDNVSFASLLKAQSSATPTNRLETTR